MSQTTPNHLNSLPPNDPSPTNIQPQPISAGWNPTTVENSPNQPTSQTPPPTTPRNHPQLKLLTAFLTVILLPLILYFGYLFLSRQINSPTLTAPNPPELELSSSPSAMLTPLDSEKIKISLSQLFTPPEFSYTATLTAKFHDCWVELKIESQTHPTGNHFKSQTTPSHSRCSLPQTASGFQEYFQLPQGYLFRNHPTQKFTRLPPNPSPPPLVGFHQLAKNLFPPSADWQILASRAVMPDTQIKTSVSNPSLSGTYLFTLQPPEYRITSAEIEATLWQDTIPIQYSGAFLFPNRTPIIPPPESEINL